MREWSLEAKEESRKGQNHPIDTLMPANAVVVRSDAAWSSSKNAAGVGCVNFPGADSRQFKMPVSCVGSPLMAEGLALREAVLTCVNLKIKTVHFESDAAQLIKTINSKARLAELYGVIHDIMAYASNFDYVCFSKIPHERNVVADRLAKDALLVSETLVVGEDFIALN